VIVLTVEDVARIAAHVAQTVTPDSNADSSTIYERRDDEWIAVRCHCQVARGVCLAAAVPVSRYEGAASTWVNCYRSRRKSIRPAKYTC
jgi:hypothetical protein